MTRDELREKVATQLSLTDVVVSKTKYPHLENIIEKQNEILVNNGHYLELADAAIDTIFAALKEPTREIAKAWFSTSGIDFSEDWQAMLSASPLAPEK